MITIIMYLLRLSLSKLNCTTKIQIAGKDDSQSFRIKAYTNHDTSNIWILNGNIYAYSRVFVFSSDDHNDILVHFESI